MANFTPPQVGIRALREAHGLSLKQLADRIRREGIDDVHIGTLSNVEKGHTYASRKLLGAWARALGLHHLDVTPPVKRSDEGDEGAA